jgi:hypothetical protein
LKEFGTPQLQSAELELRAECPSEVRRPYGAAPTGGPGAEFLKWWKIKYPQASIRAMSANCEGIEQDWPYIFTDNEFEPLIDERFVAINQGFDRIRGRDPRH